MFGCGESQKEAIPPDFNRAIMIDSPPDSDRRAEPQINYDFLFSQGRIQRPELFYLSLSVED